MVKLSASQKIENGEIGTVTRDVNKLHQNASYLEMKALVEKEYFKYLGDFVKFDTDEVKQMSFNSMSNIFKNHILSVPITNSVKMKSGKTVEDEDIIKLNFFDIWTEDPDILSFEKIVFEPNGIVKPKYYNLFMGFRWALADATGFQQANFDIVIDHIKSLCGYNENQFTYFTYWLAHIVQQPNKLPSTFCAFISRQGVGKDLFMNFLTESLGSKYVHFTSVVANVMGEFNQFLENKLVIGLDELEGSDYKKMESMIKYITTAKTVDINKKNVQQYTVNNYARLIFFANSIQAIKVQMGDRRVNIFRPSTKYIDLPSEDKFAYFSKLIAIYADPEMQKAFYFYLKNLNIEGFNFTKQVKSDDQLHLEESNKPFIRQFIETYFNEFGKNKAFADNIKKGGYL